MKEMFTGTEIRQMFLRYFEERGHKIVHSSSLVPANDPTLLFTNAGMNQFKDVFLGLEKRDYTRAASSQKCVRAGGKHNDLENVGFTNRHHTFFEMLGNFSFGDYFKQAAIAYAWELLTSPAWFGIPKDKLFVTIFKGENGVERDSEACQYWLEQGVPKKRIFEMGSKDNFWAMGDTGPCGPCSEIHYDMGINASGAGHTACAFGCECGRYVEIWNLVFMQFDRDASGKLNPLPKPSIDTGAGLERLAAVLQGKVSNYDTDLFTPLIKRAAELTGVNMNKELEAEKRARSAASLRVIADHARAATFLISDGVFPSNEGRGYVLRKILRRGIRHGRLLGQEKSFLFEMVYAVRDEMKDAYPEIIQNAERVAKVVHEEEQRFAHTLVIGLRKLDELIESALRGFDATPDKVISDVAECAKKEHPGHTHKQAKMLDGADAFKLYDTFGLPLDFIADACHDAGIQLDVAGFDRAMEEQKSRARASWKGGAKASASPAYRELAKTVFEGYEQTSSSDCEVLALARNGVGARELKAGEEGEVVLDHTPFYADSGGQVGDVGWFHDKSRAVIADVFGCVMPVQGVRAHKVIARQNIVLGDRVDAAVDADIRQATMRHHTGTHLLHAALRNVLGPHVKQAGSLVDPAKLRFDFSHFTGVADEELQDIEDLVNKEALKNEKVEVIPDVPIDAAINEYKAMALFGEKYGDKVRVIRIGDFSTELCGGTHTAATGEIGLLKLLRESSVSSGVRRVEAVTGEASLRQFRKEHEVASVATQLLGQAQESKAPAEAIRRALQQKEEELKRLRKDLEQARMKSAAASVSTAQDQVKLVNGIKVLARRVDNIERAQLRTLVDNLRNQLGSGVVALGSAMEVDGEQKVALIVGVTKDLTGRIQAGKIIAPVAQKVGGSGGGRPDMAEAGGKDAAALDAALAEVPAVVERLLQ